MHLHQKAVMKTAALLLSFLFLPPTFIAANPAVAPPAPVPAKKPVTAYNTKSSLGNYCATWDSEYTNASSGGSPLVADCKKLSSIMRSAPDSDYPYYYWLANHCIGNCKFMLASYGMLTSHPSASLESNACRHTPYLGKNQRRSAVSKPHSWTLLLIHHSLTGTCAFGVSSDGPFGLYTIGVTREDIAALIDPSIEKFTWFDKVGANGHMLCQPMNDVTGTPIKQDRHGTAWALYHS